MSDMNRDFLVPFMPIGVLFTACFMWYVGAHFMSGFLCVVGVFLALIIAVKDYKN